MFPASITKFTAGIVLSLFIFQLCGCESSTVSEPTAEELNSSTIKSKPLSEEEINSIISQFDESISNYDIEHFERLFNIEQILDHTLREYESQSGMQPILKQFKAGFMQTAGRQNLGVQIFENIEHHSNFKLLKTHETAGEQRLFYRFCNSDMGINYFDFILGRDKRNKPAIVDLINYASGEKVSATIKRVLIPVLQSSKLTTLEKVAGKEALIVKHNNEIQRMANLFVEGQNQKALDVYYSLPAELQNQKVMLLNRIQITQPLDDEEYTKAIESMMKQFPNDPSIHLIAIDAAVLKNQLEKAIEHVHLLDKQVGGDPYLKIMEANVRLNVMESPDLDQLEEMISSAMEQEPDMLEGYWIWVSLALTQENHSRVLEFLKKIDSMAELEWHLEEIETYSEFVKSPQYQEWLDYLEQKNPNSTAEPQSNE